MNKLRILIFLNIVLSLFSCNSDEREEMPVVKESLPPKLLSMSFKVENNPVQLVEDVKCEIVGDSVVECWIRHLLTDKNLIPTIEYSGSSVMLDSVLITSSNRSSDFKKPVNLMVISDDLTKNYKVYVHSFTGLPVIWIETERRKAITSKDEYLNAHFKLEENVTTRGAGDVVESEVRIKGRGNASWKFTDKKSYSLKFNKSISLFGDPKDKSYVMIANSFDKTMLRNYVAYSMGKMSNLDYTPTFRFVDLMLNGVYNGTYLLGDKLKIAKHRVNVGDDGFLLEVDQRAVDEEAVYFTTKELPEPVNIKDPDVTIGDKDYNYVKDYVTKAEETLYSENFRDPDKGYQKYLDMESFVDFYIINEFCKNYDALSMYTSCYMNLKRGGKLKMGPLWDFDISMGNSPSQYSYEGILRKSWWSRLFQDPLFVEKVKERFCYFYSMKDLVYQLINDNANYLKYSIDEDDKRWNRLYNKDEYYNWDTWGSYKNEVLDLKIWIENRFEYLKEEFNNL